MTIAPNSLTIRRPDDWHVHLRDGEMLRFVAPFTARQFSRAIIMPNLAPPITTVQAAKDYRDRILAALPDHRAFQPLMTAYLTDEIAADELERGHTENVFTAAKLYPAGATTNSAHGVTDVRNIYPVLERMQRIGMPLLVHGEVTDPEVDIFDREAVFLERVLTPVLADFPELKVVFEHATTEDAVQFVEAHGSGGDEGPRLAATITPHHLMFSRNAIFAGGIRPHYYCLPIAKREIHRLALRRAATSGDARFFLGTDTAPHARPAKESGCGCAGIFNAPHALESYAQVFAEEEALDRFEAFASENGPRFYGLPLNEGTVTLERSANDVPEILADGEQPVVPFRAGERIEWTLTS